MRHTICIFLASMVIVSVFACNAFFNQHTFAASRIANRYVASVVLTRKSHNQGFRATEVGAVPLDQLNGDTHMHVFYVNEKGQQGHSVSFRPSISGRRFPPLWAKWPDAQNGRGRNTITTGYELGV